MEHDGQEHRQHRTLFRRRRGRTRAGAVSRRQERGAAGCPPGGAGAPQGAAAHGPHRGRAPAHGRRQGAQVRAWSCDLPGRAHPPRLRLHRHLRLPRHQPLRCRAHGHRCHGRLRPRPAGALFRRRSPVPAALQADALGRERRGVHALPAVGPGAEGRTCHPHRRPVAQARPRRRDDPHLAARLAARARRRAALQAADAPVPARGRQRHGAPVRRGQARRARRAPSALRRVALPGRAQHQGRQGRPARPAHPALARQVSLRQRAQRRRGGGCDLHRQRVRHLPPLRGLPVDGEVPPALHGGKSRGASLLRRAARHGGASRLLASAGACARSSAS